jgi:hypothetical protein
VTGPGILYSVEQQRGTHRSRQFRPQQNCKIRPGVAGHYILSRREETATSKAGKTGLSEDAKLGLAVLFMVFAIMMIGPVLAG